LNLTKINELNFDHQNIDHTKTLKRLHRQSPSKGFLDVGEKKTDLVVSYIKLKEHEK